MINPHVISAAVTNGDQDKILLALEQDITQTQSEILFRQEVLRKLLASKVEWEEAFSNYGFNREP